MPPLASRADADHLLVEALICHARHQPGKVAVIELGDGEHETARLTYAELVERVQAFAAVLQRRGYSGRPIVIACSPGLDYLVAVLASMFAGSIAVPMPEQTARTFARWGAVLREVSPAAVVVDGAALQAGTGAPGPDWLSVQGDNASSWHRPAADAAAIAFVQFTSGSTGTPKGAVISHGALAATRMMIRQAFDHRPDWNCVTWLPPWHDMGLVGGLLQPLGEGMTVAILPPLAVVQRPIRWLRAIDRYRANVSGGPGFGYAACVTRSSAAERAALDLGCWQLAYCGAEPVSVDTMEAFADAFSPAGFAPSALYACYGLAEATLFVAGPTRGSGLKNACVDRTSLSVGQHVLFTEGGRQIASCGLAWGGSTISINDPISGTTLPSGALGEICVSGPHLATGYWGRAEDPAFMLANDEPMLKTGDLGFMHDGELYVSGRLKELIIVRGAKYHAEDIEDQARAAHPALAGHVAVAFATDGDVDEKAVVVVETRRGNWEIAEEIESAVRAAIMRGSGLRMSDVLVVRQGTVPRTTSGKVERYLCRLDFDQGRLMSARVASAHQVRASEHLG